MPPNTNQTSSNSHFVIKLPKNAAFVGLIIIILALVGGGFYWQKYYSPHKVAQPQQIYKYSYAKLSSYALTGSAAGRGIAFSKPVEFGGSTDIKSKGTSITLTQADTKNNQPIVTGRLGAASVAANGVTSAYTKSLATIITNPQNSSYKNILSPIKQFVAAGVGSNYETTFDTPVVLTTSNLAANSWSIDFTAKPISPDANPYLPDFQGKAVFAIGKKTYYYYFIAAVDYNWQANQSVFAQVINSLKIDQ